MKQKLILWMVFTVLCISGSYAVPVNNTYIPASRQGDFNSQWYCLPRLWEENSPTLNNEIVPLGNFVLYPNMTQPTAGQMMTFNMYGPSAATYVLSANFTPNATDLSATWLDATWQLTNLNGVIVYPNAGNLVTYVYMIPDQQDDCNSYAILKIISINLRSAPTLTPAMYAAALGVKYYHVTVSLTATI